jgi:hypothetical protein
MRLDFSRSCSWSSSVCPAWKAIEHDDEEEYDYENKTPYRYASAYRDSDSFCRRKDSIASYSGKPRRS